MSIDPLVKTITEITEEASQPVQVPLIIGSEYFVVTQQDIRKVELKRHLHFSRVNQNGSLRPVEANLVEQLFDMLRCIYLRGSPQPANQLYSPQQMQQASQRMDISAPTSHYLPKASVRQQLKWNKCTGTSPPPPPIDLRYSRATSTTDLSCYRNREENLGSSSSKNVTFASTEDTNETVNNLDAREQLRERKQYCSIL